MDQLRQDVLYALRRLRRAPGFTLVATATLALGIGANSAIFSVVHAVLLKPLPFAEPERLVRVAQVWEGKPVVYSPENFLDVAAQTQSLESLAAIDGGGSTLTSGGAPERIEGAGVSASFFDLLRVRPLHGRGFQHGENEPGESKVVVLGHGLWTRRFAADPGIVGQSVQLNREPYVVVGVAPAGFSYPEAAELWTPIEYDAAFRTKSRGAWYLEVIGRLRPGVSVESARQELGTIAARLAQQYPDMDEGVGGTVISLQEATVGDVRPALLVLLGAVGLVLLIACVNVANLLLARVAARESELAVRTALGAGRRRLLRQLLTESVLLAVLGGATGILLAWLSLDALLGLQPEGVPRLAEVRVDRVVVAFAVLLSLLTGFLFGVFPALHSTRRVTAQALREGGRGLLGNRGSRLRGGLVVGQMAFAMMLLAGAGLLIRSFAQLRHVDPGFATENALTFRISLPESVYSKEPQRAAFFDDLLTRLAALPGAHSVGGVAGLPLGGTRFNLSFAVEGRPPLPPAQQPSMEVRVVTADYFETMGIPIKRGRAFQEGDRDGSPQVVVLSEAAVRRYFPGEEPLGKRITVGWGRPEGKPKAGGEVVGIVGDVKDRGLAEQTPPEIYIPHAQLPTETLDVVVRTSVSPLSLVSSARSVVHELDSELPVARIRTLDDVVARSISEPRFYMLLLGAFAGVALLLAALGIFGVMSYAVVERSREIGIRLALGALPADVLDAVLRKALLLTLAGVGAGLAGAIALSRALAHLLFNLSPTDPTTLVETAALLTAVALLASYLPARQATRVDPLIALRSE
jgi:putative ABC transport system permease protein